VCEGEVTEKLYFERLRHETRNLLLTIEVVGEGESPKTVVERAVRLKREAERDAMSDEDKYDEVWCVFDRDEHPRIPEAMQQARDNNLRVAFSNPCFELWILLHFKDQRKHLSRQEAKALVKQRIPNYKKEIPFEKISPVYAAAVDRAGKLAAWQKGQNRERENPWTEVYLLTERIFELSRLARERLRPRV
jgi:hypothetical protein